MGTSVGIRRTNANTSLNAFCMRDLCKSQAIVPLRRDVIVKTVKKSPHARLSLLGFTKSMLKIAAVKRSGKATYCQIRV